MPASPPLLDIADRALLASARQALNASPFRDPVRVCGQLMPRRLARTIERGLSKLQIAERRPQPAPPLSHCLTCAESGGFVTGPCAWSGCPFRAGDRHATAPALAPVRSLHAAGDSRG